MPEEKLVNSLKTKDMYHYIDKNNGINIKSKEIFKKSKKIRHFPFNPNDGTPKYKFKKITYVGFENESKLPRGVLKSWRRGYGFTRVYNPIFYQLQNILEFDEVIIQRKGNTKIDGKNKKVYINIRDLDKFYGQFNSLLKEQKTAKLNMAQQILHTLFPEKIPLPSKKVKYIPGSLSRIIESYFLGEKSLSTEDKEALWKLINRSIPDQYRTDKRKVLGTKEEIEIIYIEEVLQKYKNLMEQKTETQKLEEKWQNFFKEHSWILSRLFATPVLVLGDKVYLGGKGIENTGGQIADFIYRHSLTNNITIIEIKTHLSKLLKLRSKARRGKEIFPVSDELSGGINQVLVYKDTFQKNFLTLRQTSKKEFESYNPRCILVIGKIEDLNKHQRKSFELFRSNSKDVEIITFDELFEKIKAIKEIMVGEGYD